MSCASRRQNTQQGRIRLRTLSETLPPPQLPLPQFEIALPPPDLSRWQEGNCGVPGAYHFEASHPGPHVAITALMHGNEYSGACALAHLLRQEVRPERGRLSLIFLNLAAFARFDPARPTLSRFIDEDMNRLWEPGLIASGHTSYEMERVRAVAPILNTVDALLDLHSMLWPADPLFLSGLTEKSCALATALAAFQPPPPLIVQDSGHEEGPRLIDYVRFASNRTTARACLLEAGQHWQPEAATLALNVCQTFLEQMGTVSPKNLRSPCRQKTRQVTVTDHVLACTSRFVFARPFGSGEIIKKAGTLLAFDGCEEIRTPYENCLLVMPNLRPMRGHTAVRLARCT
ncbi:succinylglutamate desuccinylase/aspartoacylase family protein [Acetobacter persici]|uniref:succinylglutamate desuccinylase/aspartoacylase domain-containing protein n=1 Tax=Acetobacter persici TaxID=1076596 RepID=UPI001BAB221E|nr:succinylglutamate desuccinylase/aspartoacylase family protein [Acetobacter persici]MBS1001020.1 succinylglutamate desuccinylase/aspartoacylase family protein [Acetobacter persici]